MKTVSCKINLFMLSVFSVFIIIGAVNISEAQTAETEKVFTIVSIEPSEKNNTVNITFSAECSLRFLKKQLKVFPPARLSWSGSKMVDKTLTLKGNFRRSENYAIFIPKDTYCKGHKYVETLATFQMPEHLPSVELALPGTVIERDSRQMIHTRVVNIDHLLFKGLRIPVFLIPYALQELNKDNISLETVQEVLERKYGQIESNLGNISELQPFIDEIFTEQQLFFPVIKRNKTRLFSVPLSFRKDRQKGAVEIIQFIGEDKTKHRKVVSPANLFRITDLSLTYKQSKNRLLVWVTSLNTGKPVSGVSVLAFTKSGSVMIIGKTDLDGIMLLGNGDQAKQYFLETGNVQDSVIQVEDIAFIAAHSPTDTSYIVVKKGGNVRPEWVDFDVEQKGKAVELKKSHVFTERGIYRPGETVNFKGTIREYIDGAIRPPQDMTGVEVEIIDSKGETAFEKTIRLSGFGTFWDAFATKSYSTLGTYTLNVKWDKQVRTSRSFEVQEFRPPRHFVEAQCRHETKMNPDYVNIQIQEHLLKCDISGRYYAGGPVKHGKLRWKVYLTGTNFIIPKFRDYTFGHDIEQDDKDLLESGESMLDEKGNLTITLPMSSDVVSGFAGLELAATVVDFDGRAATGAIVYQEKPFYLVGIKKHDKEIRAGQPQKLSLVVVDPSGEKVLEGTIAAEVMEQDWLYVQKRNEEGDAYWDGSWVWRKRFSSKLDIHDGIAFFDFDFVNGGRYVLKFIFTSENGKTYSSATSYDVEGYFQGYGYENKDRNFEKMFLAPEKNSYPPDEDIKVFISPHRKVSSLLVSLERDDLIEYHVLDGGDVTEINIFKAQESFAPNVYITCLTTVAREDFPVNSGQIDNKSPTFLYGAASVGINKEPEKLVVRINEDEGQLKYEPGADVKLRLSVTDEQGQAVESETALCVVDESILNMTGFQTPTLESLTKFTLPLSVFTADLRAGILKQTPFRLLTKNQLTGGGGLKALEGVSTTKFRKDFRPVAYYNPALTADDQGIAQVSFTLPDTMTLYRVYAVSVDKTGRFASVQRGLTVVKDFYLEPGLPSFFTKGDRFTFEVSAFNKTDKPGDVTIQTESDSHAGLTLSEAFYLLKDYDRVLIPIQGEALKPGKARFAFKGALNGKEDAVELKVPVNSGYILWKELQYGTSHGTATINYDFPDTIAVENINPDEVTVSLTVSGSPFLRLAKGMEYLLRYPYGCVEQTSSGILPLAGLRKLIQEGLIPGLTTEKTDKYLKRGIERLFSMQTESGGFGYWSGHIYPSLWGTIYATSALSHAQKAGFQIDQVLMKKAKDYLSKALEEEMKKSPGWRDKTFTGYAAYILSLNNALEKEQFNAMYKNIDVLPKEAALLLLLAGKKSGFASEEELSSMAYQVLSQPRKIKESTGYHAPYREPAIALLASTELIPENQIVSMQAASLLGGINKQGIWTSTSDTGWSLIALGAYFSGTAISTEPVSVTVKQNSQQDITKKVDPKLGFTFSLNSEAFLKKPEVVISSDKSLIYQFSLTFPREDFAKDGYSKGFHLHKVIENTDGTDTIKVGDVVKVTVTIDMDGDYYRYVVLDDPLPAGLVAINSAIATEEPVGTPEKGSYWSEWNFDGGYYRFVPSYFEIRNDRVLAFKDWAWKGRYQYSYFARAVCEGTFVMPSTKVQLMYNPKTVTYSSVGELVVKGRE